MARTAVVQAIGAAAAAYLTSFDPNDLCANYLADSGGTPIAGAPTTFSFNVPAGRDLRHRCGGVHRRPGLRQLHADRDRANLPARRHPDGDPACPADQHGHARHGKARAPPRPLRQPARRRRRRRRRAARCSSWTCRWAARSMTTSAAWPAAASSAAIPAAAPANPAPATTTAPTTTSPAARSPRSSPSRRASPTRCPSTQQTFEDVPPGSTFWLWIERLSQRGASSAATPAAGRSSRASRPSNRPYFRPNNNVTRGQLSKIASGAAGWTETPTGQTFEDVAAGSTFYLYIERIASRGHHQRLSLRWRRSSRASRRATAPTSARTTTPPAGRWRRSRLPPSSPAAPPPPGGGNPRSPFRRPDPSVRRQTALSKDAQGRLLIA